MSQVCEKYYCWSCENCKNQENDFTYFSHTKQKTIAFLGTPEKFNESGHVQDQRLSQQNLAFHKYDIQTIKNKQIWNDIFIILLNWNEIDGVHLPIYDIPTYGIRGHFDYE